MFCFSDEFIAFIYSDLFSGMRACVSAIGQIGDDVRGDFRVFVRDCVLNAILDEMKLK